MHAEDHDQPEPQQAEDMHPCHVRTVTDIRLGDVTQDTLEALLEALDAVPREQFENARSVANLQGMGREKAEAEADRLRAERDNLQTVANVAFRELDAVRDERDEDRAEADRLRQALRPFAGVEWRDGTAYCPGCGMFAEWPGCNCEYRQARAALADEDGGE